MIVCAHRYTVRDRVDSRRAMLGMCYILQSDLSLPPDTNIGANNVLVVREALRGKRLTVIPDFDNHARYGVCQVKIMIPTVLSIMIKGDTEFSIEGPN